MNMPTTEQCINNKLQQVIALNAVEHSALTSAQAVVLMTSYLIERRSRNKTEQQEIDSFLKVLYPECLRPKKKMQELSSLGFNDRCNTLWNGISKIDIPELKKRIENLQLSLIVCVEDAGYFSFGKNLEGFANARDNESYIWMDIRNLDLKNEGETSVSSTQPVDLEESTLQTEHSVSTTQEDASVSNTAPPQNSVGGVSAYRVSKVDNGEDLNKPFVQLYQDLLNSQPNGKAPEYVWQWLLTQKQYDDIKSCFYTNGLPSRSIIKPNTADLLCLYIGEFYKREYDGNNSFPVQISQQLFSKLYECQTIQPYRKVRNNTNLFTLYVSGGLPIHYLANQNNQYRILIRALVRLLDSDSDDFEKEIGEQLLSRVNNTALRESYIQKHSIYKYIETVRCGGEVWNKSDNSISDFQKMSHFVQEYKNKLDERFCEKFRTKYSLWIDSKQSVPETISPTICLYPEEDGERHYALSKQRLNALGVSAPCNEFELCVKDGTTILTSLHFSLCSNGDYIADDLQQAIPLDAISVANLPQKEYNIEYQDAMNNKQLKSIDLLPKWGYLQFYTNDDLQYGASYVTPKGSAAFSSSAVLYDSDKWKVESVDYGNNDTSIQIPKSSLRWVLFKQCVTLVSVKNSKTRSLYNKQGRFYAIPKQASYSKFDAATSPIISNENHCYSCQLNSSTDIKKVHLVKDTHIGFDLYKASDGAELKDMQAEIDYRYINSDRDGWKHYDPDTPLSQGYVQFRILLGTFESIVKCFVLAHDAQMIQEKNGHTYRYRISKVTDVASCHNDFAFNN